MNTIGKCSPFLFIILSLSGLLIVLPVNAQSIPKPAVPEFTAQFVDSSYDIPTPHTFDPYTGQKITNQGTHVEEKSIEIKIRNQPFETFYNTNGQAINLYYNIRIKGHFEQNWTELYRPVYGFPQQSTDSEYTVFSYPWVEQGETPIGTYMITLRNGAQADFQVEAMIGYIADSGPFSDRSPREYFEGETSGWSNTQTIKISETSSASATPSASTAPDGTVNSISVPLTAFALIIVVAVLATAAGSILIYRRARSKPSAM
jgi:hypothetical protein